MVVYCMKCDEGQEITHFLNWICALVSKVGSQLKLEEVEMSDHMNFFFRALRPFDAVCRNSR